MSDIKFAIIQAFRIMMEHKARAFDVPCDIVIAPYGKGGCKIVVESVSYNKVKIQVEITWFGGCIKATAEFKGLGIPPFHGTLESVLKSVDEKVFDLATELALIGPKVEEEPEEDPDDEEVFEVTNFLFTAEQFQEELKTWNVQSEVIDGQLWIKEKDNAVACMAATILDKQLKYEKEA